MLKILISLIVSASILTACSGIPTFRLDVQQGNAIEDDRVAQLRPGMSQDQVLFLMGSPQVQGAFRREDRWDYVFYHRPGRGATEKRRVTVFFDDFGRLDRFEDTQAPPRAAQPGAFTETRI